MADLKSVPPAVKGGSLVAIVGTAAASLLLAIVPLEESGRVVQVNVARDGTATVKHLSGPQYLSAYLDIAGVATACDGLTRYQGKPIRMGMRFTEAQCASMLEHELASHGKIVMACSNWDKQRQPYQIFASVSMNYNTGGWCGSTAAKRVKAGNIAAGCDALLMWNKATVNGRKVAVPGLTKRRHRELEYCITGVVPGATSANLAKRLEPWK
jgi:lysozyme